MDDTVRQGLTLTYLHADHLGSASLVTGLTGTVVSSLRYTPYGLPRGETGRLPTPYRYTGQREMGVGFYDYQARLYDPAVGRFAQADTVVPEAGKSQSLNRYVYALNNPVRYTDPSGHWYYDPGLDALVYQRGANYNERPQYLHPIQTPQTSVYAKPQPQNSPVPRNVPPPPVAGPIWPPDSYVDPNFCQLTGRYAPDYVTLNISLGPIVAINPYITRDRYGNTYLGVGVSAGESAAPTILFGLPVGANISVGNYERNPDGYPTTESQLIDNYTGLSVNGAIGFVIGGGVMQNPQSIFTNGIDPTFSEIGVYVPQLSVGASYTFKPFNFSKENFHW